MDAPEGLSLYVHIPFCIRKCPYCDFNSYSGIGYLIPAYLEALVAELRLVVRAHGLDGRPVQTVFLGGGTPSLLVAEQVGRLLGGIGECLPICADCETTLEANPGTVDTAKLTGYRAAGVNRLSLGVQSFDDAVLAFLGRIHSAEDAREAVAAARDAGFENVSLDLIWAVPGQTLTGWMSTLREACSLSPEHVSAYCLTYEEGTPIWERRARGEFEPAGEDLELAMLRETVGILTAAEYSRYEVSNFARPGLECRHNVAYWTGSDYIALGAGAHSHLQGLRWWNERDPARYVERVAALEPPVDGSEQLKGRRRAGEAMLVGLRMLDGVCFDDLMRRTGGDVRRLFAHELEELAEMGLLDVTDRRARLTRTGLELADEVGLRFVEAG